MIRWLFFLALAAALTGYAFWIYLRVDLPVPGRRRLAILRALVLLIVLLLLFDVRLPAFGPAGASARWVLLDASLSMDAAPSGGASAWSRASARVDELRSSGWNVVTFGSDPPRSDPSDSVPTEPGTLLAPALQRAAEGGARRVIVLSDLRFQDAVAVRSALEALPVDVEFEAFADTVVNAGVSRIEVPDFAQDDEPVTATIEVHGGAPGDTLAVDVLAEAELVATLRVPAPAGGLRATASVELPPPGPPGRVRYTARVRLEGDAFAEDDRAVDYAAVGRTEGALVLLSLVPDWEPRYLLPVLRDVSGFPTVGYLRAGPNRFVQAGRAADRGDPVDSARVRQAVSDAALVVLHGVGGEPDGWTSALLALPGRKILMPGDASGAALAGVPTGAPRAGEWYVSADVPSSPIAGSLSGTSLQGLPPLSDVLVPDEPAGAAPMLVQLRGAGAATPALRLEERPSGRVAVVLASGFWRWAAREGGREAYRRLWSGVVGWMLADRSVVAAEPRPARWVVERGEPVVWNLPTTGEGARVLVRSGDSTVVDSAFATGGGVTTGILPPGPYTYRVESPGGDSLAAGRFDVSRVTEEMLPEPAEPPRPTRVASEEEGGDAPGRPLRTSPWPYLLVIGLLCGEWVGRRRSGLR